MFDNNLDTNWDIYPRPQLKRDSFFNLNGKWKLSVLKGTKEEFVGDITVPYPPESKLSGIERTLQMGEKYVYNRNFTLPDNFIKDEVILHFGAVDQITQIKINNQFVGENVGGYLPFEFNITGFLIAGENSITVTVTDDLNLELPYGKQRKKRGGMWYTPISGIWQTVWLESVPTKYISHLKIETKNNTVTFITKGGENEKTLILNGNNYSYSGDIFKLEIDSPIMWSPESPYLYGFKIISGKDTIESYFALRDITIEKINDRSYICLNGKPYFFNGVLDQGYFDDGIFTPNSPEVYKNDILSMKSMGFNMLRKHIKIEPEIFYYYCDKYGMIVFQDMVNSGKYNFWIDTALPTIGIKKLFTHRASKFRKEHFEKTAKGTIDLLYNHPSVCYYTVFNEGWGQYDADKIYTMLKNLDTTRVWDATSGWFNKKLSDVTSEHVYFKPIKLKANPNRPLVLSEFGGYSYKIPDHSFNLKKTYGYRFFTDSDKFVEAMKKLYLQEVASAIEQGLCATVLTQLSDVEDETNGLITYDRKIQKIDPDTMQSISNAIYEKFNRQFK
ncbi:MAG: glycoside hydrolase family 2 [Clostridia bacterium]|nr:glycoside hydrolase family 2 [Clostridia bacterium]